MTIQPDSAPQAASSEEPISLPGGWSLRFDPLAMNLLWSFYDDQGQRIVGYCQLRKTAERFAAAMFAASQPQPNKPEPAASGAPTWHKATIREYVSDAVEYANKRYKDTKGLDTNEWWRGHRDAMQEVLARIDHKPDQPKPAASGAGGVDQHPVKQPIVGIQIGDLGEGHESFTVGRAGVTRIEATTKSGLHADIPYVRVWAGDVAVAEFCQHNIIGVIFAAQTSASDHAES